MLQGYILCISIMGIFLISNNMISIIPPSKPLRLKEAFLKPFTLYSFFLSTFSFFSLLYLYFPFLSTAATPLGSPPSTIVFYTNDIYFNIYPCKNMEGLSGVVTKGRWPHDNLVQSVRWEFISVIDISWS